METENDVLNFIFPSPCFNIKDIPNSIKEKIIYIPTERKIKDQYINEKIPCLFIKNEKSSNILIEFHCNGADMFNIFPLFLELSKKYNINILIPEYPGYSIYESPYSSEKSLENSLIIYDYVLKNIKNITEKNIFILGRSLGTGPATYLSSKRNPAATFLISPYTTFGSVGKRFHSKEECEVISKHFRSIDYIDKINNPLLIIHGKADKLIDHKDSIELYEKCKKDIIKDIALFDKMGHNLNYNDIFDLVIPTIIKFTEKNCPTYKIENKDIKIDFDKELYAFPEGIKKDNDSDDEEELNYFEE